MLLDTSGLLCLAFAAEPRHTEAQRHFTAAPIRVTHNLVLAEFVPLAEARRMNRSSALAFLSDLQTDPAVEVVYVDATLHEAAVDFLKHRLDKRWSLCDAVSFLLMQARGLTDALTTDHHFEQAGFVRLLTP